jgi:hypothetical protein
MKYIIAGGRDFNRQTVVQSIVDRLSNVDEIVSGDARGADAQGVTYAIQHNIPVKHFPANWDKFGKSAGFIRNAEMGEYVDALIAFWDGQSRGTAHMIQTMKRLRKPY